MWGEYPSAVKILAGLQTAVSVSVSVILWGCAHATPEKIVAMRITGSVMMKVDDQTKPVAEGEVIRAGAVIQTQRGASVVLALSSDVKVQLGGETELVVTPFGPQPASSAAVAGALRTVLRLNRGELIGTRKKPLEASGPDLVVETPVGAVGGGGAGGAQVGAMPATISIQPAAIPVATTVALTTMASSVAPGADVAIFRVLFRPAGTGQFVFAVATLGMKLQFGPNSSGDAMPIGDGQEITVMMSSKVR